MIQFKWSSSSSEQSTDGYPKVQGHHKLDLVPDPNLPTAYTSFLVDAKWLPTPPRSSLPEAFVPTIYFLFLKCQNINNWSWSHGWNIRAGLSESLKGFDLHALSPRFFRNYAETLNSALWGWGFWVRKGCVVFSAAPTVNNHCVKNEWLRYQEAKDPADSRTHVAFGKGVSALGAVAPLASDGLGLLRDSTHLHWKVKVDKASRTCWLITWPFVGFMFHHVWKMGHLLRMSIWPQKSKGVLPEPAYWISGLKSHISHLPA